MPFDGLLEDAHDEGIERGLLILGAAGQSFVEIGWHTDLEVDDGLRHCKSPRKRWLTAMTIKVADYWRRVKDYLVMIVRWKLLRVSFIHMID